MGVQSLVFGNGNDDMMGKQNKKLIKTYEEEKNNEKNDVSIMAGLFDEANKDYD